MFLLIVFGLPANFSQILVKVLQHGRPSCWGKKFLKRIFSKSFSNIDRKNFGLLAKNTSAGISKMISTCPGERLEELFLAKRTCNLLPFPDFDQKTFVLSTKFSGMFIKTALIVSRIIIWCLFEKIQYSLYHFRTISKKFNQLLAESFR